MQINKNTNFGKHNTSPRPGKIEYIAIHYVGATGDAAANVKYYNEPTSTRASADYFVGHAGDVWEYNPDPKSRYTWAVGGRKQTNYGGTLYNKALNKNSISVEMCVKTKGSKVANSPDWYFTEATVNATVELVKYLMAKYDVPASKVIRHFDVNGKLCPGVVGWNYPSGSETAWNDFKSRLSEEKVETVIDWYRVRKSWDDAKSQLGAFKDLARAKSLVDRNPGFKVYDAAGKAVYPVTFTPYMVTVTASALNVRKGPGTKYGIVQTIKRGGAYTIVEESNGWGKLKSGAGWIKLSYTKRI